MKSYLLIIFLAFQVHAHSFEINFSADIHIHRLNFLKNKGFDPKVIYDIGAYKGYWSLRMRPIFPKSSFYLFEANSSHKKDLEFTKLPFFIALLGNKEEEKTFFSNETTGDSMLKEKTRFYENCQEKVLPMRKLSTLVKENNLPYPDLVKLDVQGAEKLIIEGSPEIIQHAEAILLEVKVLEYNQGAPLIAEIFNLLHRLGYVFSDLLECHYLPTGELNEMDCLFLRKDSKYIKKGQLIE